jgi:hypothetical protein
MTPEELAEQVPSLEELYAIASFPSWVTSGTPVASQSSGFRQTLFVPTGVPVRILGVALSFEYWNLAASDTNYWMATAEIGSGTNWPDHAVRTTQNTGGTANGGITARTPWTFDAAAWSPDPIVAPGQALAMLWTKFGSPAAFAFPVTYTIRYSPV